MTTHNSNWIFVSAGEVSGDIHGASLISEIKKLSKHSKYSGIGGDNLIKEGVKILCHIRDISFIGFSEVIRHLPLFRKILKEIESIIQADKPAAAILVDYPGFNLKLAKMFHKYNIPVFYYISPQVWAWGKNRVEKIKKYVDLMAVFFDFEEEFYKLHGINVKFIGHPLVDKVKSEYTKEEFYRKYSFDPEAYTIGLLPGSRIQEVRRLLPPLLDAFCDLKSDIPDLQGFVSISPTVDIDLYNSILNGMPDVVPVQESPYNIMLHSKLLFVASGTATVESAISGTPMIVVYKISPITYMLSKFLVRVNNFAMVNIIAGKPIVPELLQNYVNRKEIAYAAKRIIDNEEIYNKMKYELNIVHKKLGEPGAARKGAEIFIERFLRK